MQAFGRFGDLCVARGGGEAQVLGRAVEFARAGHNAQVGEAAHIFPAVVAERAHPDIQRTLGHVRVVSVGAQRLDEHAEAVVVAVVLFAHGGHVAQAGRHFRSARRAHGDDSIEASRFSGASLASFHAMSA